MKIASQLAGPLRSILLLVVLLSVPAAGAATWSQLYRELYGQSGAPVDLPSLEAELGQKFREATNPLRTQLALILMQIDEDRPAPGGRWAEWLLSAQDSELQQEAPDQYCRALLQAGASRFLHKDFLVAQQFYDRVELAPQCPPDEHDFARFQRGWIFANLQNPEAALNTWRAALAETQPRGSLYKVPLIHEYTKLFFTRDPGSSLPNFWAALGATSGVEAEAAVSGYLESLTARARDVAGLNQRLEQLAQQFGRPTVEKSFGASALPLISSPCTSLDWLEAAVDRNTKSELSGRCAERITHDKTRVGDARMWVRIFGKIDLPSLPPATQKILIEALRPQYGNAPFREEFLRLLRSFRPELRLPALDFVVSEARAQRFYPDLVQNFASQARGTALEDSWARVAVDYKQQGQLSPEIFRALVRAAPATPDLRLAYFEEELKDKAREPAAVLRDLEALARAGEEKSRRAYIRLSLGTESLNQTWLRFAALKINDDEIETWLVREGFAQLVQGSLPSCPAAEVPTDLRELCELAQGTGNADQVMAHLPTDARRQVRDFLNNLRLVASTHAEIPQALGAAPAGPRVEQLVLHIKKIRLLVPKSAVPVFRAQLGERFNTLLSDSLAALEQLDRQRGERPAQSLCNSVPGLSDQLKKIFATMQSELKGAHT